MTALNQGESRPGGSLGGELNGFPAILSAGLISGLLVGLVAAFWVDRGAKRRSGPSGYAGAAQGR